MLPDNRCGSWRIPIGPASMSSCQVMSDEVAIQRGPISLAVDVDPFAIETLLNPYPYYAFRPFPLNSLSLIPQVASYFFKHLVAAFFICQTVTIASGC